MNQFGNNEPQFGGGSMTISGNWINKNTGKQVIVRDSIIDGDDMIVITDQGQISMNDFSNNYIQVSDDIYDESGAVVGKENVDISEFIKPNNIIEKPIIREKPVVTPQAPVVEQDDSMIKKVFDKLTTYPSINISVEWDNFPEAQINTLVNFLDVDINDISKYIIKNYLNNDIIAKQVSNMLNKNINK